MRTWHVALVMVLAAGGCKDAAAGARAAAPPAQPPTDPATAEALEDEVVLPKVTKDATQLLFSWLDDHGRMKASSKIEDVPPARRERVLVTDLSLTAEQRQSHRYAFFADLTAPGGDGRYEVVAVSRFNAARGEKLKVQLPPVPEGAVIVYSAEWCGFCKKAKKWLAEKNVPFVERDVEKQSGVADELREKLAAAKVRGGGVPVIDWDGNIIVGFDQRRLGALLAERTAGGH